MTRLVVSLILLPLILAWPQSLFASDCNGDCVKVGQLEFSLSLGYGQRNNPVVGQSDIVYSLVPKLSYYGKRFFIQDYDLGYTLADTANHQVSLLATPGFEQIFFNKTNIRAQDVNHEALAPAIDPELGLDPDNSHLTATSLQLDKRYTAGLAGIEYAYIHDRFEWQIQLLQDFTKIHHGQKIRSALSIPYRYNRHMLQLKLGATWQSQKLVNYYYGVQEHETPSHDFTYQTGTALSGYIKGTWGYRLNKHWSLRALASYKHLGQSVADSPLVTDDTVTTWYVGGTYHF